MGNQLEIYGIWLQVTAGFIFILDQVLRYFKWDLNKFLEKIIDVLTGSTDRKWRIPFVIAPFAILIVAIFTLAYGTRNTELTVSVVGGALVWALLGAYFYGLSLQTFIKLYKKYKKSERRRNTFVKHYPRIMLLGNGVLLGLSLVLMILYVIKFTTITDNLYIINPKSLLEAAFLVLTFMYTLPVLLSSLLFMLFYGFLKFLSLPHNIPRIAFWCLVLSLWTIGGILLLIHAYQNSV